MIEVDSINKSLYDLIDSIKENDLYKKVLESYNNLFSNQESKKLIDDFNRIKEEYSLNESKENTIKLSNAKSALYNNSFYKEYDKALKELNLYLKDIETEINDSIFSDDIKKIMKLR